MKMRVNAFKAALREKCPQIGLWCSLCSAVAIESIADTGFDWVLVDTEHSPNELPMVHAQLQAVAASPTHPVVRPPWNDAVALKRLLDIGVQTVLVPFVQTADEARRAVEGVRYPPAGMRGVSSLTRANGFGRIKDYFERANDEICVLAQVETRAALGEIEAIGAVDGIDGIFIGPSDLAADLGHLGHPRHPEVQAAITDAVPRILATGKAAGILAPVEADARRWLDLGCTFVAIGSDLGLLARGSESLLAKFHPKDDDR